MKFIATQENVTRALSHVIRATQKNTSLPILENILLEVSESSVEVMGTNLEIGIRAHFRAKVEKPGKITLPSKLLYGFLSHIPSENTIEFRLEDTTLYIESGKYKADITGISAEEYPLIPQIDFDEDSTAFQVKTKEFREKVSKAMVCVAPNDVRVEFSGVYMKFLQEKCILVSTDSFRLLEIEYEGIKTQLEEGFETIIPLKTLQEVLHCLSQSSQETFSIVFRDGQIFFRIYEGLSLVSQLISGNFPDYTQIIPQSFRTTLDLNVEEMMRAIKLANIFTQNNIMEVLLRVDVEKKTVEIDSKGGSLGKNTSILEPSFIKGDSQEILFNPRYIGDILSLFSEKTFRIHLVNESSPALFGFPGKDDNLREGFRYILMPIKK